MPLINALVGVALIGAAMAPAAEAGAAPTTESVRPPAAVAMAADEATDGEVHASYTRRFTVTNLGSKPLKLLSVDGVSHEDGHSPIGTVVEPMQSTAFEVTWLYLQRHELHAAFAVLDGSGTQTGTVDTTMTLTSEFVGPVASSQASATGGSSVLAQKYQITVLDAPGTVIDVPATDPVAQGEALSSLCSSSAAQCRFTPTGAPEKVLGPVQVVGKPVNNTSTKKQVTTLGGADTVTTSHSVEISATATATVLDIVEASITAAYGYTVERTHEFSQFLEVTIPPLHRAWVEAEEPVLRTTGDFTITAGNTTWTLRGVQFLTPDPDPKRSGELWIRTRALTPDGQETGPVTSRQIVDDTSVEL